MENYLSLFQFAEKNIAVIEVINDRLAIWFLGYLQSNGPKTRDELFVSVKIDERENINKSLDRLIDANLCVIRDDKVFNITDSGRQLAGIFGIPPQNAVLNNIKEISCDVFYVGGANIASTNKHQKQILINTFLQKHSLFGEEGNRFGFVECNHFRNETIFGYLTQEYWDSPLRYDSNLNRQNDWILRNSNLLFVWPLNTNIVVFQDAKFYNSPLNMRDTRNRIGLLLERLLSYAKIERTGNFNLIPYERNVTRQEMQSFFSNGEEITLANIEVGTYTKKVDNRLPVFNPRDDWNDILTEIINEYELPNVSTVRFNATKYGSLAKSKIAKTFALAGCPTNVRLGRGEKSKIIRQKVPAHIGRVNVSEPVTEDDIINLLGFLQENLSMALSEMPLPEISKPGQVRFEII